MREREPTHRSTEGLILSKVLSVYSGFLSNFLQSILIGLLGFQIIAPDSCLSLLTFPKASSLNHWENQVKSAL